MAEDEQDVPAEAGEEAAADAEPLVPADVEPSEPVDTDAEPLVPADAGEQQELREPADLAELERTLEALLFLSSDPVTARALADAADVDEDEAVAALEALAAYYARERRGIALRQLAGCWSLASNPEAEDAARRLFGAPRTPPLTPAQAETLAVVAYLQPVSRPEIARIRGVNAESAAATLIERGVIEEAGRSQFGAVLYRTTDLFLRLFGLQSVDDLPDVTAWDPSPEVAENIRDRLLRAGEARLGVPAAAQPAEGREPPPGGDGPDGPGADAPDEDEDERPSAPVISIAPAPRDDPPAA